MLWPKRFTEKKLQLFQMKIFFDDDFKESVKVTDVQKCDFSQSWTLYFQNFAREHAQTPLEGLKFFSRHRVAEKIFFRIDSPQPKEKISEPWQCSDNKANLLLERIAIRTVLVQSGLISVSIVHVASDRFPNWTTHRFGIVWTFVADCHFLCSDFSFRLTHALDISMIIF